MSVPLGLELSIARSRSLDEHPDRVAPPPRVAA